MNENNEFHIPFIKSLLIIATITLLCWGSVHYFISERLFSPQKSPIFTSYESQKQLEQEQNLLMRPVSQ